MQSPPRRRSTHSTPLRGASELVELLAAWPWQIVHASRRAGATREQIADATRTTVEQARTDYAAAIDRQDQLSLDISANREVL